MELSKCLKLFKRLFFDANFGLTNVCCLISPAVHYQAQILY
jgi:hypothetical protein